MKTDFPEIIEQGRCRVDALGYATKTGDRFGAFRLRCPATGQLLRAIVSDGRECGIEVWEHVSVSHVNRCPTWEEMCWIKSLFWNPDECVVQFHPAEADYVNMHPFVLHLWKALDVAFPMPPMICV